jgi:glycosyltransferase involved in cell wall biosynthesis
VTVPSSIAAVIIARNEAANIERCVRSVLWCDEVVVVDDRSTDGTPELAAACGARVVTHPFESFATQRNWALTEAGLQSTWVLMLDADEVSTEKFQDVVRSQVERAAESAVGFQLCRKTMFFDHWLRHADGFPVWIMRIVRRSRAHFVDSGHGEVPVPQVEGVLPRIAEPFLHYPFSKGLHDWWQRHNTYSSREAEREWQATADLNWSDVFSGDSARRRRGARELARRLPCRPWLRFLYHYVWCCGFLDGRPGWEFSRMMATYEGLIVLKKWELAMRDRGKRP